MCSTTRPRSSRPGRDFAAALGNLAAQVVCVWLLTSIFAVGSAEARKLYLTQIVVGSGPTAQTHEDATDKLTNIDDFYSNDNLLDLFPTYPNPGDAAVDAYLDMRGLRMFLRFAQGDSTLRVVIPGVLDASFEGNGTDRESSLKEFEEFLRGTAEDLDQAEFKSFLRSLVKDSPVDPVAGNPNSLQSKMVLADWRAGLRGPQVEGTNAPDGVQNLLGLGGEIGYGRGCDKGCMDVTSLDLPITYDLNLDKLPISLLADLPIAATWTRSEWSIMASVGIGGRWRVRDGWSLTVMGRFGGVGSIDVGALAIIYSASIVNRMEWDWRGYRIGMGNQWSHLNTADGIEIAGIAVEYGLNNDVLRNGLDVSGDLGRRWGRHLGWSIYGDYSHYFGSELYSNDQGEAGVALTVLRDTAGRSYAHTSVSLTYFGANDYNGLRLGFLLRF